MADLREQLNAIAERLDRLGGFDADESEDLEWAVKQLKTLSAQPAPAGEVALPEPFAYLITDDEAPADVEALAVKIDGMLKKRADLFQIKNTMAYLQAFSGWDSSAGQFIADHGVAVSELLRRLSGAQQVVMASFPPRSA